MTTKNLDSRVSEIVRHLAAAFGGLSQVSPGVLGQALAGQINNNDLGSRGSLEEICQAARAAYDPDEECGTPLEEILGPCREALLQLGVDPAELPHPVAA